VASFALPGGAQADAPTKMYWTEQQAGVIKRANVDGTSIETLVTSLGLLAGIALDGSGKMYWAEFGDNVIKRQPGWHECRDRYHWLRWPSRVHPH